MIEPGDGGGGGSDPTIKLIIQSMSRRRSVSCYAILFVKNFVILVERIPEMQSLYLFLFVILRITLLTCTTTT